MIQIASRACAVIVLLVTAPNVVLAQGVVPSDEPLPTTENAALVYWQAIALLPKLNDDQRPFVEGSPPYDDWLDETAESAFAATETSMDFMRHAARLKQCDWGTNLNDGPVALLPHTAKCRELARLATFRVVYQSRRGSLDKAVDDGLAILSLARHLSRDRLCGTTMTGYAIEALGVTALAEVVPQLNPAQLRSLAERHAALPARPPIGECILSEKRAFLGWFARAVKAGRTDTALFVIAVVTSNDRILQTGAFADAERLAEVPWLRTLRAEVSDNPERLTKLIEQTAVLWDEAAKLANLSADELPKKSEEWLSGLKDVHPLSRALLPPLAACHTATVFVQARHAIMQAGIACCLDRKTGLQMYPEPFSGKQFTLQEVKGGFELRSDLGNITGEPLIVRFGRSPAAK
jgi:hypothetical protein